MKPLLLVAFAALCGALLPLQAGANARLGQALPTMFHAALANFLVGGALLLIVCLALRAPGPPWPRLGAVPWWAWTGGLMGALYVAMTVLALPRLGAVLMLSAAVVGQMIGSIAFDHYGALGAPVRPFTPSKAAGAALLLAGIALIRFGR